MNMENMEPEQIQLSSVGKQFEYEKLSREIDEIQDIETLRNFLKSYIKLFLKHKETIVSVGLMKP